MKLKAFVIFFSIFVLIFCIFSATPIHAGTPNISVTPMSVNFGNTKLGGTSGKTITIKNTGTSDLVIAGIDITGINASEFSQTNDCTSIPMGSSCVITGTFAPTLLFGKKSAIVSITSNDPKKPTVNVKASGNAPPPKISASPVSVNFGNIKLGGTSGKTITIKNTGTSDLVIAGIDITGINASEFSQTNDCTSIPMGSSCVITGTFAPTLLFGKKSAIVSITSNDPNKPIVNVKASGNAPPPKISASPAALNFGNAELGGSSGKTITIKNTGTSDLVIAGIDITGTNASEFSQTNDCTSIPMGSSCVITGTFAPTSTGSKNATITVGSNDPKKPTVDLKLSGNGIPKDEGVWTIKTIDKVNAANMPIHAATDANNAIHVVYDDFNNRLKYATNKAGTWVATTIFTDNVNTYHNAGFDIAVDGANNVHIVYATSSDGVGGVVALYYATDASGSWITTKLVDYTDSIYGYGFSGTAIAATSSGKVHIAFGGGPYDLLYLNDLSGAWIDPLKLGDTGFGVDVSMSLDSSGQVYIAHDSPYGLKLALVNAAGAPVSNTLIDGESVDYGPDRWFPTIAINKVDNSVYVSYWYWDTSPEPDVRLIKLWSSAGGITSIDNDPNGSEPSITVDQNGKIYISYADPHTSKLKYATNESGTWVVEELPTKAGSHNSDIVVESTGKINLIYYNPTTSSLSIISK
jgi:hypothetical protein